MLITRKLKVVGKGSDCFVLEFNTPFSNEATANMILTFLRLSDLLSLGADEAKRKKPCASEDVNVQGSTASKRLRSCGEISTIGAPNATSSTSEVVEDVETVTATLESRDLWDRFNELGTEMIITKSGR